MQKQMVEGNFGVDRPIGIKSYIFIDGFCRKEVEPILHKLQSFVLKGVEWNKFEIYKVSNEEDTWTEIRFRDKAKNFAIATIADPFLGWVKYMPIINLKDFATIDGKNWTYWTKTGKNKFIKKLKSLI